MTAQMKELYIVVDIEASGPYPSRYALLSIGACTLARPRQTFYVELRPDKNAYTKEAMAVNGFSLERLMAEGLRPEEAMQRFADWLAKVVPGDARPVFTAFNAPFDWMFVNDYFWCYLGRNPFGHSALDIKAYYMGLHSVRWEETSHKSIGNRYAERMELTHHALRDAIDEAELFEAMLAGQYRHENEEAIG
jgi:ribonuclease T